MKFFAALLFAPALCCAADFSTGQAARMVIGQSTFTDQSSGTPAESLGAVGGLAIANDTLFVVDSTRVPASPQQNRVLFYRKLSSIVRSPLDPVPQGDRCPVCRRYADTVIGQTDFTKTELGLGQGSFRTPTAVASDGKILAVADTDNNRILIWNSIPADNGTPADVVLGQPDFKTVHQPPVVDSKSFRGPQGVWIQGTRLYVADTQNHRVMVWNNIPASNNQPADFVLGQPNFSTAPQPDLTKAKVSAKPDNLLNPVSVTSDGTRLYVTDLGHNRVLVWNSIPTQTAQPADFALGQPDLSSADPNNVSRLCPASGKDDKGNDTFPARCAASLSFPRFAISDGTRLFIADGGNDRVLIYNTMPTVSGQRSDVVLGQTDEFADQIEDTSDLFGNAVAGNRSSADTVRTPMSLALDPMGNLYVSDPYDRRVLVFSAGEPNVPVNGVRNAASRETFALGAVSFGGSIKENDEATIKVASKSYTYKVQKSDTLAKVIDALVAAINASGGDPNVLAIANHDANSVVLTSRIPGEAGNAIAYSVSTSASASILLKAANATLTGAQNAARIAPGSLISISGEQLSATSIAATPRSDGSLPTELGGVQVYIDGIAAPLIYVSPTQINAQMPFEVVDASSSSAYVWTKRPDGTVHVTSAIGVPIVFQNPGVFAQDGPDITEPRPAIALHANSVASAAVSFEGAIKENDTVTVTINGHDYSYTVKKDDTLASVRDAVIALVNANADEVVTASAGGSFVRMILTAKAAGAAGNGISISTKVSTNAQIAVTALSSSTCCAGTAGGLVTPDNPAVPGETLILYATGLGQVKPVEAQNAVQTGFPYTGPANEVTGPLDVLAGGKTANVLSAGLKQGTVGVYEIQIQLNSDLPTNLQTQLTVGLVQDVLVSNTVTIAVKNPNDQP